MILSFYLVYKYIPPIRCQSQERRISVTLRSTEGEFGDLLVTVVAAMSPAKAAKVRTNMLIFMCVFGDIKFSFN